MNDYPPEAIREYRENMKDLEADAAECVQCDDPPHVSAYDADTLCTEHAAARAVYRRELFNTRLSPL